MDYNGKKSMIEMNGIENYKAFKFEIRDREPVRTVRLVVNIRRPGKKFFYYFVESFQDPVRRTVRPQIVTLSRFQVEEIFNQVNQTLADSHRLEYFLGQELNRNFDQPHKLDLVSARVTELPSNLLQDTGELLDKLENKMSDAIYNVLEKMRSEFVSHLNGQSVNMVSNMSPLDMLPDVLNGEQDS